MSLTYPALEPSKNNRVQQFDKMHESSNWFSISHDGWHLPATLEKHDWCGDWFYRGCLNEKGHAGSEYEGKGFLKTFQRSCFRADCELCFEKWLARESSKATRRTEKYEEQSKKHAKHIIISAPEYEYGKSKKELAETARMILKKVYCEGGSMIFHAYRYNKETRTWYWSPHFHVIGFGWINQVAEAYSKHGWVIKNKGTRESVFSTYYYLLSHCGIKKNNHALVWFGDLSYSKLKVEDYENENKFCPYCSEELQELYLVGDISHKPPDVPCELAVDVADWTTWNTVAYGSEIHFTDVSKNTWA